ncbi:hypothetical protein PPYR_03155 [Photinus pyralis]|uniref:Uncharacterized protein n=1 Tax=Photinus pyralis TaxID=7054 RepID=A0A5N4A205_PHOPY|nr:hypothetical protein PPYR_03155 [Photinus pyralis]
MQERRIKQGRSASARVATEIVLYKSNMKSKESTTLELYLRVAHALFSGSLRSELAEFSPLLLRKKLQLVIFFFIPTLIEGKLSQIVYARFSWRAFFPRVRRGKRTNPRRKKSCGMTHFFFPLARPYHNIFFLRALTQPPILFFF